MAGQSVPAKLRLAARAPRVPVPLLAATHTPRMLRPLAPLAAARTEAPHPKPIPMKGLVVPEHFPRWEAPAIGAKGNPLPRYMFRPQHQPFVARIKTIN